MKIGIIPENPVEWVLLKTGVVPRPLLETFQAMLLARTIMAGAKLGVFEALAGEPMAADDLAKRIGTDPRATEKLLNALVGTGYLSHASSRYSLAPVSRKWLLPDSEPSLHDNLLFRFMEWEFIGGYEKLVQQGQSLNAHEGGFSEDQWNLYQRGMRSLSGLSAQEVAKRMPVPRGATTMLDIGGSHGYYSVATCRRHPGLNATILDLPEAVASSAAILARENMGDRVVHREGNVLTDDLGEGAWDFVFISNLVHHFDAPTNRELAKRVANALKPGGTLAILEIIRPESPNDAGQMGALMDLFFALTSLSGTWSLDEISDWEAGAGLTPGKPIKLHSIPGGAIVHAKKPHAGARVG